jgi:hypothetical protein
MNGPPNRTYAYAYPYANSERSCTWDAYAYVYETASAQTLRLL